MFNGFLAWKLSVFLFLRLTCQKIADFQEIHCMFGWLLFQTHLLVLLLLASRIDPVRVQSGLVTPFHRGAKGQPPTEYSELIVAHNGIPNPGYYDCP